MVSDNTISRAVQYACLCIFLFVLNFILLYQDDRAHIGLIAIWLVTFISVIYAKFDLTHPLAWFSGSFSLYNSAYAILSLFYSHSTYGLTGESLRYSTLALSIVILVCGFPAFEHYYFKGRKNLYNINFNETDYNVLEKTMEILFVIAILLTVYVSRSFVSKSYATKSGIFGICAYLTRVHTFLCGAYIISSNTENIPKKRIVILCGILCVAFAFLNAERDCLLRYALVVILALYYKKKIKNKHLLLIVPLGMLLTVLQNVYKYFFINRTVNSISGGLIQSFLSSDFGAPGGNLQNLINNDLAGYAGYSTIINDIILGIFPHASVGENYSSWYNNFFFRGSSWSRAFTLVGEGYLIDGANGVIVLFLVIAFMIIALYSISDKGLWSKTMYLYGIITIISSFRGTLIDIITGMIRVPLISFFIYMIFYAFYNKGRICIKF